MALASWMLAATVVEIAVGAEFAQSARQVEERLEMRILGSPAPAAPAASPEQTHDESIEPWELVSV
jgi:hypothetical protein